MTSLTVARKTPHNQEQLFALVADVESYPEFVSFWQAVRTKNISDDHYSAEQIIRIGPLRYIFYTDTFLSFPSSISVRSYDAPFRFLFLNWEFTPLKNDECAIDLRVDFEMLPGILNAVSSIFSETSIQRIVTAFENRAKTLYARTKVGTNA